MLWRKQRTGDTVAASCRVCGGPMLLVRTIPAVAHLPELRTFRCQCCGVLRTDEIPSKQRKPLWVVTGRADGARGANGR